MRQDREWAEPEERTQRKTYEYEAVIHSVEQKGGAYLIFPGTSAENLEEEG